MFIYIFIYVHACVCKLNVFGELAGAEPAWPPWPPWGSVLGNPRKAEIDSALGLIDTTEEDEDWEEERSWDPLSGM